MDVKRSLSGLSAGDSFKAGGATADLPFVHNKMHGKVFRDPRLKTNQALTAVFNRGSQSRVLRSLGRMENIGIGPLLQNFFSQRLTVEAVRVVGEAARHRATRKKPISMETHDGVPQLSLSDNRTSRQSNRATSANRRPANAAIANAGIIAESAADRMACISSAV